MFTLENTALIVIDIQEKLFRVIHENDALAANNLKLIKGMQALGVPVIVTEQNPKGLGPTLPEIADLLPGMEPIIKFDFSCCREPAFEEEINKLKRHKRNQFLITGIETHICVYQTALELNQPDSPVKIVTDCVSSRTPENKKIALKTLASQGVGLTTTEMILFELLGTARHEKFKEISGIIK